MCNRVNWKYYTLNIFIILIICLCSGIDSVNGRTVSIIEVLAFGYNEARMRVTWLDGFSVILYGNLYLALPVIASIPTMPLVCDELRSGNYEFHFSRIGVKRYVNQRYMAAVWYSITNLLIAFFLLWLFLYCNFPSVRDYGDSMVIGIVEKSRSQMLVEVCKRAAFMSCWGGMLAVFACNLASVTQNMYIVLCVPFLLNYIAAPYLFEAKVMTFVYLALLLYMIGYRIWIWKYQGVRE